MVKSKTLAAIVAFSLWIILSVTVIVGEGVGVSGPDQIIQIQQGEIQSSYLRIWNDGEVGQFFVVEVEGNCSGIVNISPSEFSLAEGGEQLIKITYSAAIDQYPGTYEGFLTVYTQGEISSSVTRRIFVNVTAHGEHQIYLREGTNLIGWVGTDATFEDVLGKGQGATKVWTRNPDGSYTSAQFYPSAGVWWSIDEDFTRLEYGCAYFIECKYDLYLEYSPSIESKNLLLESGTNLIVWTGEDCPLGQAFPQDPQDYSVIKVWRRRKDGEYEFAQYYPSANSWWSKNSEFNQLKKGGAYFVESKKRIQVSI